jgi:signal transduction histidine kinase
MKKFSVILAVFVAVLGQAAKAQNAGSPKHESSLLRTANTFIEKGISRLKTNDTIRAIVDIQLSETYLPRLSKKEAQYLQDKITDFFVLWVNLKFRSSRGSPDDASAEIQTLASQLKNSSISKSGEAKYFADASNLALLAKNKAFYIFAKTSLAENLIKTSKAAEAMPILDTLSTEPSLSAFEKVHILSLLIINNIKLTDSKNLDAYFNMLQALDRENRHKADRQEYILAEAWYFDYRDKYAKAIDDYETFLVRYGNTDVYGEQAVQSLIKLGAIWGRQNKKDSAVYYLQKAKRMLSTHRFSKEAENMYQVANARYGKQSAKLASTAVSRQLASSEREILEDKTRQLEYRYRLEIKNQQAKVFKQQSQLAQLKYSTARQRYWLAILLLIVLVLVVSATGLFIYMRRKQALVLKEAEIDHLKQAHQIEIIKVLSTTQQAERKRIAEQLHDDVGSSLTVARLNLSSLADEDMSPDISPQKLRAVNDILGQVAVTIREMSHQLMPATMLKLGFKKAVYQIVDDIAASGKIKVGCIVIGFDDMSRYVEEFQTDLYHIIQELFQNIIKHSDATQADLQLVEHPGSLNLIMEDNGKGFNLNFNRKGSGLNLLTSRVELYGGAINTESSPASGTTIIIDIPAENIVYSGFKNEPEFSEALPRG